jgi:RHS repeat-associated protein
LIRVEDSSGGVFAFAYDLAGRLLSSATPVGTVQYARDAAGRVTSRQVVGQASVAYTYDPAGNLASASTAQASASFTYDARNALGTLGRSNGVSTGYLYDPAGRVLSITHSADSSLLSSQTYTYDAVGNRASQTTNIGQPLITQVAVGQYDSDNRQLGFGGTTQTFDDNGNLISATGPSGTTTYTWDSRNRLKAFTTSAGQTATFTYDFAGNLITQDDSGPTLNLTQNYVLDDLTNVAYQSTSDGNQLAILSGRSIDQHIAVVQSSGVRFGLPDALGSTVATVDETGATSTTFLYEPFGQTTAVSGSYPFLYTGRMSAAEGLYYYRARFYSPTMGRFISEDPIGFAGGGLNLYRYASNAPTLATDPLGLAPTCIYSQGSGLLTCVDAATDLIISDRGFSGGGRFGRNNPGAQEIPYSGPIPIGEYVIHPAEDRPRSTGPISFPLTYVGGAVPFPASRDPSSFVLHGGTRSEGCVIVGSDTRDLLADAIRAGGGGTLIVVQ